MRKIVISVAPVSALDTNINPQKIANDVIKCAELGANMVHLHVRDENGKLTDNLDVFKKIVELIREKSDIVIQASTGGVSNLTIEERCAPLYYDAVETTSLNVGSCNLGDAVYINPIEDVKYCVKETLKNKKIPEVEVFELGMIDTTIKLQKEFNMDKPVLYNIVLGHVGTIPPTIDALYAMKSFIPKDDIWGVTHANRKNFDLLIAALSMGASTVRIGFEDSAYLNEDTIVRNNYELVEELVKLVDTIGLKAATPSEVREMLNIK